MPDVFADPKQSYEMSFNFDIDTSMSGIGWTETHYANDTSLAFAGYTFGKNIQNELANNTKSDIRTLINLLTEMDGNFGLLFKNSQFLAVRTDHICSFPIFYHLSDNKITFFSSPAVISEQKKPPMNEDGVLQLLLSGFVLGDETLHDGINRVPPSSMFIFDKSTGKVHRKSLDPFKKYIKNLHSDGSWDANFEQTLSNTFKKQCNFPKSTRLVIPLSAGYDSRVILTQAIAAGYRNIFAYTYGIAGSFEHKIAESVCYKLGIEHHFVESTTKNIKAFFKTKIKHEFERQSDDISSGPIFHDLYVTHLLLEMGQITKNDVLVNGNSGDFITGNHIPIQLSPAMLGHCSEDQIEDTVIKCFFDKHCGLWPDLQTDENFQRISTSLQKFLRQKSIKVEKENAYLCYEFLEYYNRQIKNVVKRQKIYDYFDLEWRMPLWDVDLMHFWLKAPFEQKYGQTHYKASVNKPSKNSAWSVPVNQPKYVSPKLFRYLVRPLAKAFFLPFGKSKWHKFERRYISYFTDNIGLLAAMDYSKLIKLGDFRNYISIHTYLYAKSKNINTDLIDRKSMKFVKDASISGK